MKFTVTSSINICIYDIDRKGNILEGVVCFCVVLFDCGARVICTLSITGRNGPAVAEYLDFIT